MVIKSVTEKLSKKPKGSVDNVSPVRTVRLDSEDFEYVKKLGAGSFSHGVHVMIKTSKKHKI